MTDTPAALHTEPAWTMGPDRYQYLRGVHRPWVAEISPMQLGCMSRRQQERYRAKRAREWDASDACREEWRGAVVAAYKSGAVSLTTPNLHADARKALLQEMARDRELDKEMRFAAARRANDIDAASEVAVGDRIYSLMGSRYVRVVKVLKARLDVVDDRGQTFRVKASACMRKSYTDLQAAVEMEIGD